VELHKKLYLVNFVLSLLIGFLDKGILPNLICILVLGFWRSHYQNIDGKQVEFNLMIIVIVKCFNYSWKIGCESGWIWLFRRPRT